MERLNKMNAMMTSVMVHAPLATVPTHIKREKGTQPISLVGGLCTVMIALWDALQTLLLDAAVVHV